MPDQVNSELIEDALAIDRIDKDLFRSRRLWKPNGGRGVFGGQVIAQAAWAATLSVREDAQAEGHEPGQPEKGLHSLHSYFLSFGDASQSILYSISRLRSGRSYATRSVLATQSGTPIFSLTCSFALPEPDQPQWRYPVPGWPLAQDGSGAQGNGPVPRPEDCLPSEDRLQLILDNSPKLPRKVREYVTRNADERRQSSIEVRNADANSSELGWLASTKEGRASQAMWWFRSRAKVGNDPAFQKCVLAYASDLNFIGTAAKANNLTARSKPGLGMLASLDHSMWFYDETVDASEWLLFSMECPIVMSGRGTVTGRIYKQDGSLAVVCAQEGVVRAALL